jgi:hypothetical protein
MPFVLCPGGEWEEQECGDRVAESDVHAVKLTIVRVASKRTTRRRLRHRRGMA